jgi:hypothetical protein
MSHWGFWEWLGYSTLWVAAIILAFDGGLKMTPEIPTKVPAVSRFLRRRFWAFAPLALLILSAGSLVLNEFDWVPWRRHEIIVVYDRNFKDEEVDLDNHQYINCSFDHVTFKWNGEDLVLENDKISGNVGIRTENRVVANAYTLLLILRNAVGGPLGPIGAEITAPGVVRAPPTGRPTWEMLLHVASLPP